MKESEHPFTDYDGFCKDKPHNLDDVLKWIVQLSKLLSELRQRLLASIRALKAFNSPGGDQNYFVDMTDQRVMLALGSIKESFMRLVELEDELTILDRSCMRNVRAVC